MKEGRNGVLDIENGRHFVDDISYSWLKNIWIWNRILLQFVLNGLIDNKPALVENGLAPNRPLAGI